MLKIKGVDVTLFVDGAKTEVADDGLVGSLLPGTAVIRIAVAPEASAFVADRDSDFVMKRMKTGILNDGTAVVLRRVNIQLLNTSGFTVSDRKNSCRVFSVEGSVLSIYSICLISQEGAFYLVTDLEDRIQMYRSGLEVLVPDLKEAREWTASTAHLVQFIQDSFAYGAGKKIFPDIADGRFTSPVSVDVAGLPEMRGKVLWWNTSAGYGLVKFPKVNARVHWLQVSRTDDGRAYLAPGELVEATAFRTPVGKSTVPTEAVGVKVITDTPAAMTA